MGNQKTIPNQLCKNGTRSATNTCSTRNDGEHLQVVLTAGLDKLGATTTKATPFPTGSTGSTFATASRQRVTSRVKSARMGDRALVWAGAVVVVLS